MASSASLWRDIDLTHFEEKSMNYDRMFAYLTKCRSIATPLHPIEAKLFQRILSVAARSPKLEVVVFRPYYALSSQSVDWFSNMVTSQLVNIDLSYCVNVSTETLDNLVNCHGATLKALDLSHTMVEDSTLLKLHQACPVLEDLSLAACFRLSRGVLAIFLQMHLPRTLKRIDLRYLFNVRGEWLVQIPNEMMFIDVRGVDSVTVKHVRQAVNKRLFQVANSALLEDDTIDGYRKYVRLLSEAAVIA